MILAPGMKDRGVILTTVTEPPEYERFDRRERERPSGNGLFFSRDDAVERKRWGERCREKEKEKERGGGKIPDMAFRGRSTRPTDVTRQTM